MLKKCTFSILFTMLAMVGGANAATHTSTTPTLNQEDGCYHIKNADELYGFAALVNGGEATACGKLDANITVNENVLTDGNGNPRTFNEEGTISDGASYAWIPIGNSSAPFKGTFYGQGHTISGLYLWKSNKADSDAGLFGYIGGDGITVTIENVGIVDSYFRTYGHVGGLIGRVNASGSLTISKVYNASVVVGKSSGNGYAGGLIGGVENSRTNSLTLNIINAYNTGAIYGPDKQSVNGLVGSVGENGDFVSATLQNCYNYSEKYGKDPLTSVGFSMGSGVSLTLNNDYYLASENNSYGGMIEDDFSNGNVFALLRSGEDGDVWYQYSGEAYPDFTSKQGESVIPKHVVTLHYFNGNTEKIVFADGSTTTLPTETSGWYDNVNLTGNVYSEISSTTTNVNLYATSMKKDKDGCYEIADDGQLYEFALFVNSGNGDACGKLTANITVNQNVLADAWGYPMVCKNGEPYEDCQDGEYVGNVSYIRKWTPIGTESNPFTGSFNGQGYTISGLYFNDASANKVGLFGFVGASGENAVIQNVGVVDSYFAGESEVGGIVGCISTSAELKNVYNAAVVKGSGDKVGGIAGIADVVNMDVTNAYNIGSIFSGAKQGIAGIVGYIDSDDQTKIENCYNYGRVVGKNGVIDGIGQLYYFNYNKPNVEQKNCFYRVASSYDEDGVSDADFENGTVFALLHDAEDGSAWKQYSGDAYPSFAEKKGESVISTHVATLHYSETDVQKVGFAEGSAKALPSTYSYSDNSIFVGWYGNNALTGNALAEIPATASTNLDFYAKAIPYVDGCYELSDADMLFKFADVVNNQNATYATACAKLTADIVVNENVLTSESGTSNVGENGEYTGNASGFRVWTPIGGFVNPFKGSFDGQGHTVSGLYLKTPAGCSGDACNASRDIGLFGNVYPDDNKTVSIKNVGVEDSYFSGNAYIGGIVGYFNNGSSSMIIENSYSMATIYAPNQSGGLVGYHANGVTLKIENSYSFGNLKCNTQCGALVGVNYGENPIVVNSYYLEGTESRYGSAASSEAFSNGVVATLLHGEDDASIWGQNVTVENHPSFFKGIDGTTGEENTDGPGVVYNGPEVRTVTLTYPNNETETITYVEGWGVSLPSTDKNGQMVIWYDSNDNSYDDVSATATGNLSLRAEVFEPNGDGFYEIDDVAKLYKFAAIVNGGKGDINGKLTADIVVNTNVLTTASGTSNVNANGEYTGDASSFRVWTPIGYFNDADDYVAFAGMFDGNGHTISGLYFNDENASAVGLFAVVENENEITIKNVGIEDSYFNANNCVGGILGVFWGGDEAVIENVYSEAVVVANQNAGGIVGEAMFAETLTIANAYNAGKVFDADADVADAGSIVGYVAEAPVVIENCYNAVGDKPLVGKAAADAEVSISTSFNYANVDGANSLVGTVNGGKVSVDNSFYLGSSSSGDYGVAKSAEEFANGTVFAALRGADESGSWYQYQDDDYPSLSSKSGTPIHAVTLAFSETDVQYIPYVEGSATPLPTETSDGSTVLGWYDNPEMTGEPITEIPASAISDLKLYAKVRTIKLVNGCYEITNADQLYEFADIVNGGESTACGKLTANITVNSNVLATAGGVSNVDATTGEYIGTDSASFRKWTPIGYCTGSFACPAKFQGSFDGQGYTISGLYCNDADAYEAGLFGYIGDTKREVTIQNVNVEDSYFRAAQFAGGILGRADDGTVVKVENVSNAAVAVANSAGGVVGRIYGKNFDLTNAYSVGAIYGTSAGGLVGNIYSDQPVVIKNSYNYGTTNGGALIGSVDQRGASPSVTNSFYLADETTGSYGSNMSAADFANGTVFAALHSAEGGESWRQYQGDLYPTLSSKDDATGEMHVVTLRYSETDSTNVVHVEGVATTLPTKDKEGNSLAGWTTSPDGTGDVITEIPATASDDIKLYPKAKTLEKDGDWYLITSADDLYLFAEIVNNGESTAKAKLMNDIVVNENVLVTAGGVSNVNATTGEYIGTDSASFRKWTPIGYMDSEGFAYPFTGSFDGQGYTISGLYFNDENVSDVGLFGSVGEGESNVSIINVGIEDSYFRAAGMVGGIVGDNYEGASLNIKNVYNAAVVVGASDDYVGGIVGFCDAEALNITNVYNEGSIFGKNDVGGLLGAAWADATISNSFNYGYVAGGEPLVGNGDPLSVTNSFYLADETTGSYGTNMSAADFANGTVLAELRSGEDGYVWVQAEGDKYPTIDINASKNANTIVLDWTNAADSTALNDVGYTDGAMVIVKDGKKFYANGAIYEGILSADQVAAIGDDMLHPVSGIELATDNNKLVAIINGDSEEPLMIPTNVEVSKVVYERELTAGAFATIMVPFEVPLSSISSGFTFYKFKRMAVEDGRGYVAKVMTVKDKLEANTPYIIVASKNSSQVEFALAEGNLTLNTNSEVYETRNGDWTMKGVYERKNFEQADPELGYAYGFVGQAQEGFKIGSFVKAVVGNYVLPMGVYLVYDKPKALGRPSAMGMNSFARINEMPASIGIEVEDEEETTVVKKVTIMPTVVKSSDRWFDMKGRALGGKPTAKGTYYHNGQRVIIK